jgi:hypothetical protein
MVEMPLELGCAKLKIRIFKFDLNMWVFNAVNSLVVTMTHFIEKI